MRERRELSPLLTDLYELTMAYGYWKNGRADRGAAFHLFFRKNPFNGGYTIAAGLEPAIEWLRSLEFEDNDLEYLRTLKGSDGERLFPDDFLHYLSTLPFQCDIDALPEGTVAFPFEPMVRVTGPILQAQLVESALLNIINFQSLIATKAARLQHAARDATLLEFGLRRAQGPDGAIAATRAAYLGGCSGTSNVLAAKIFDIPAVGTHAHSWVAAFDTEPEAFEAYAAAMPANSLFLVDTYDTLEGVRNAAAVGLDLKKRGYNMLGIRLDSGDLAWLSSEARKILDEAGLKEARIVASNDLDEYLVESLRLQNAPIDVFAVGTRLVTGHDQAALGGVYKLTAVRKADGSWQPRIKVSEQTVKTSIPGVLQVRRFTRGNEFIGDMLYEAGSDPRSRMVNPLDGTQSRLMTDADSHEDLLVPVFRGGELVYSAPSLKEIRERVREQMSHLHPGMKRFANPHRYKVGLEETLHHRREEMILAARSL
jgi:nicotinate phosphoribosyltransferase